MSRYTIFAVIAALCLAVASGAATTPTTAGLTTASFTAPPGKVFDYTVTADSTTWYTYTNAYFGPGATNATVYAYGITYGATASKITKIGSRPLNATLLSNGTADTTMSAAGTDGAVTGLSITADSTPQYAVGLGSIAFAYVAFDTATVPCKQVYVTIYAGGANAVTITKAVTSNVCVVCTYTSSSVLTAGTGFAASVGNIFYENGTYFVSYAVTKYAQTPGASGDCVANTAPASTDTNFATTTTQQVIAYLQGVADATAGTATWSTVPTLFTGTTAAAGSTPSPTGSGLSLKCGPSNYTNSTTYYCTYSSGAALNVISLVQVTVASGAVGSAATLSTDTTTTAGTYPLTTVTYSVAGFAYSLYQTGILLNNQTAVTAASGGTPTYTNTLQLYNITGTPAAAGVAVSGYTNTVGSSSAYTGAIITYGTGFAVLDQYISSTSTSPSTYTFEYTPYFANGTLNGTKTSVGSSQGLRGNWFADTNGALWFGAYNYDNGVSPTVVLTGNLGKVVAQLYSAGNILASFFALISLMIAALFAF